MSTADDLLDRFLDRYRSDPALREESRVFANVEWEEQPDGTIERRIGDAYQRVTDQQIECGNSKWGTSKRTRFKQ